MATIHSFPTELIRHTLSLAYPPGEPGSGRGLSQTSLVHSSWHQPARSLMTGKLDFSGALKRDKRSLTAFVLKGPTGWRCRSLSFSSCPDQDVRVILGKAQPGGIKALRIQVTAKQVRSNLLEFLSLQITVHFMASWTAASRRHLSDLWPELFEDLSARLTSLKLDWPQGASDDDLNELEGLFPNLTRLTIKRFTIYRNFGLPACAAAFIASLPNLSSLTLASLWPSQLEQLLGQLDGTVQLAQLAVSLWRPTSRPDHRIGPENEDSAWSDWIPALQRCIELPALQALARWKLSVQYDEWGDEIRAWSADFSGFVDWPHPPAEAWSTFREKVAAAGVELILGPLHD